MTVRYSDAGVDLHAAEIITERITARLGNGLFGGFIPVGSLKQYDEPVLVSSIDGIGSKVRLASRLGKLDGLGADIVHHCVNDIAVHGATPLFFMDYLAFHHLTPETVERLVASIADACAGVGMQLAGGETAEMPSVYPAGRFDVAGAVVGVIERRNIIDGSQIRDGDVLVGFPSSGLHTNGFSLVQHLFGDDEYGTYDLLLGRTLGAALLEPHRCYLPQIRRMIATGTVHGLAHITGGGIPGNLSRIIPDGLKAEIHLPDEEPPLVPLLRARGIAHDEMRRVFNLGIGLIAVCDPAILTMLPPEALLVGAVNSSTDYQRKVKFSDDA